MKKFFSYITIVFAALLLTGCANNTIVVNNDEVIKFDGGSITKTDAYKQLITAASYDTTYKLLKSMLTQVDMQLLEKNTTYTSQIKEEEVNTQYADMIKQIGDQNQAFQTMTSQLGISITNEEEAKKAIRYTMLVQQCVLDRGSSEEEIAKAYEQRYGEKVSMKYIVMSDQKQASDLQQELVSGSIKLEDIVAQFTEFQKVQQEASAQGKQPTQTQFTFNTKYVIASVVGENEQSLTKKLGILKAEDEAVLFQRSSKDTWLAPMELQSSQSTGTEVAKQYVVINPYKYTDATKQLDDTVKAELKKEVAGSKLQNPNDIEKIMREYRKANGFEIKDAQLKKAFDAYEKTIDSPETGSQNGATTQQTAA